jgi:hypothetical protein
VVAGGPTAGYDIARAAGTLGQLAAVWGCPHGTARQPRHQSGGAPGDGEGGWRHGSGWHSGRR